MRRAVSPRLRGLAFSPQAERSPRGVYAEQLADTARRQPCTGGRTAWVQQRMKRKRRKLGTEKQTRAATQTRGDDSWIQDLGGGGGAHRARERQPLT